MRDGFELPIAIIGAGASGLVAAIKLKEAGYRSVTVFEKASDLGGTWRDNRYPGLHCDIPSHAYRYSFAPNAEWSRTCAPGSEILAYLRKTATDYELFDLIRFNSEVVEARFVDQQWVLETADGFQGAFGAVITATGVLHHPVYPDIPGLETYRGKAFHSARWDDEVDLSGKRLGVIGTGSTAVQITTSAVSSVAKLELFQRTAQWVSPWEVETITEEQKQRYRSDPDSMQAEYESILEELNFGFAASIVGENPEGYQELVRRCQDYLATVRDPVLRQKLTPDYEVGCKRLIMGSGFYEAIQKPNAELVTEKIERFCPEGILTSDGLTHELDVIVLATGFNTHQFFRPMKVYGRDGVCLDDVWKERNEAYLTVAIPGFPNWFMIGGPSSPIGNFSWLLTSETQLGYILQLVERLRSGDAEEIAPRPEAAAAFNKAVQERLPRTIWMTGCTSWYIDQNGSVASWPWTFEKFQTEMSKPNWEDYELLRTSGSAFMTPLVAGSGSESVET